MAPQVSCHSPALHVILLVIPLQSSQTQQLWAHHSPSQIPHSQPAGLPALLLKQVFVPDLTALPSNCSCCAMPQPRDTQGSPPAGERRNEVAASYALTWRSEITEAFTLLHDYVQFHTLHSSAAEKSQPHHHYTHYISSWLLLFFHNIPITPIFNTNESL